MGILWYRGTSQDDIHVQAVRGWSQTCCIGRGSCRPLRSFFFISTFQIMHIFATSPSLMTKFATSATEFGKKQTQLQGRHRENILLQGEMNLYNRSYFPGEHKNKLRFKGIWGKFKFNSSHYTIYIHVKLISFRFEKLTYRVPAFNLTLCIFGPTGFHIYSTDQN